MLKVHIPESYLPSLATSCESMASNSERIMDNKIVTKAASLIS